VVIPIGMITGQLIKTNAAEQHSENKIQSLHNKIHVELITAKASNQAAILHAKRPKAYIKMNGRNALAEPRTLALGGD
jgi:hypothetical protein